MRSLSYPVVVLWPRNKLADSPHRPRRHAGPHSPRWTDLHIHVIGGDAGELIRELILDPTGDYPAVWPGEPMKPV
jgi:hypothetical protein